MPRKVMLAIVLFVVYAQLHSQNALDFKMTDLDNNEWHLFNELDKGKTVVLDFFFADCIPCQTLTPQIVTMYNDYGNDTGQVLIFGISDRDTDTRLKTFEFDYGVNYPSCGTDGGGDTITDLYRSWYPFTGWPTYAVICPNTNMSWDLPKNTGLLDIRSEIDECILYTSISEVRLEPEEVLLYPNPVHDHVYARYSGNETVQYEISTLMGSKVISGELPKGSQDVLISLSHLKEGVYIFNVRSQYLTTTYKLIKSL